MTGPDIRQWWGPTCGMVRSDMLRPICRHGVPDPPRTLAPRDMEPLPPWHPCRRDVL